MLLNRSSGGGLRTSPRPRHQPVVADKPERAAVCHNRRVDFVAELRAVHEFLDSHGFRSAVIGGVALAAYGHPRMTLDLDMVTESAAQDVLVAFMESRGFTTLHRSSGYSNHRHPERRHGRVDFMYVQGRTSELLFGALRHLPGPGGVRVAVPRPEHLIAMKVHAIRNDPRRRLRDLADIGFLLGRDDVDRESARRYFEQADLMEAWDELQRSR